MSMHHGPEGHRTAMPVITIGDALANDIEAWRMSQPVPLTVDGAIIRLLHLGLTEARRPVAATSDEANLQIAFEAALLQIQRRTPRPPSSRF